MRLPVLAPRKLQPPTAGIPDLRTQLESLLDCVWRAEAEWRFDDRLELALRHEQRSAQR